MTGVMSRPTLPAKRGERHAEQAQERCIRGGAGGTAATASPLHADVVATVRFFACVWRGRAAVLRGLARIGRGPRVADATRVTTAAAVRERAGVGRAAGIRRACISRAPGIDRAAVRCRANAPLARAARAGGSIQGG